MIKIDSAVVLNRDPLPLLVDAAKDIAKLPGVKTVLIGLAPSDSPSVTKYDIEIDYCGGVVHGC